MKIIGASPSGIDLTVQNQLLNTTNEMNHSALRLATLQRIASMMNAGELPDVDHETIDDSYRLGGDSGYLST